MANKSRPNKITIRFSDEELENFKSKVTQSGMTQQQYCVKTLLEKEIKNTDGLKQIVPHLGRMGNNLNQIARKLNQMQYVDFNNELKDALRGCSDVWQLLKQYLRELH